MVIVDRTQEGENMLVSNLPSKASHIVDNFPAEHWMKPRTFEVGRGVLTLRIK